jgi:hypothetical protein
VIELERCLPMVSPAYDLGASEAQISDQWRTYFTKLWASSP